MTVVDAVPAHAEVVATLHAATIGQDEGAAWDAAWVARLLALPGAAAALALEPAGPGAPGSAAPSAPGPVGFVLGLPAGEAFDIAAIGVLSAHRRGGIGRALLARLAERARSAGALRLMLEVAADNAAALGFYRAAGFAETGRRRGYYRARAGGSPRDALVLGKPL